MLTVYRYNTVNRWVLKCWHLRSESCSCSSGGACSPSVRKILSRQLSGSRCASFPAPICSAEPFRSLLPIRLRPGGPHLRPSSRSRSLGYIRREKSPYDGRSSILNLTDKARPLLSDDPLLSLFTEIETLDDQKQQLLRDLLRQFVCRLGSDAGKSVGSCTDCVFLLVRRLSTQGHAGKVEFFCQYVGRPVGECDLKPAVHVFPLRNARRRPPEVRIGSDATLKRTVLTPP